MKPETIKQAMVAREGFSLVAFRQAALPVFLLRTRFLTLARRELKAIPEFVLRAVDAGLTKVPHVAGFLGVEESLITTALSELINLDTIFLGQTADGRSHHLQLTPRGDQTLERLQLSVPEEQVVSVSIDGLTRKYISIGKDELIRGAQLQDLGLVEMLAAPSGKPEVSEVEQELRAFYSAEAQSGKSIERDMIEVLSVERADRMFRDDVYLLFYRADGTGHIEIGVMVGDQISPSHTEAFREIVASRLRPEVPTAIPDAGKRLQNEMRTFMSGSGVSYNLQNALLVGVFQEAKVLHQAIAKAQTRLLISSARMHGRVVDEDFVNRLEGALTRGVAVTVVHGSALPGEMETGELGCRRRLESLAAAFPNMRIIDRRRSGMNVLAHDDVAVMSAFGWLSYSGDPSSPTVDERGFQMTQLEIVDRVFASHVPHL